MPCVAECGERVGELAISRLVLAPAWGVSSSRCKGGDGLDHDLAPITTCALMAFQGCSRGTASCAGPTEPCFSRAELVGGCHHGCIPLAWTCTSASLLLHIYDACTLEVTQVLPTSNRASLPITLPKNYRIDKNETEPGACPPGDEVERPYPTCDALRKEDEGERRGCEARTGGERRKQCLVSLSCRAVVDLAE